jgi:hypothetical protein
MFVIAPQTVSVQTVSRKPNGINRKPNYNPICIINKHGQYAGGCVMRATFWFQIAFNSGSFFWFLFYYDKR